MNHSRCSRIFGLTLALLAPATFTNAAGSLERRPFAGNLVPRSMMDPVALKALPYFPTPNQPGAPRSQPHLLRQEPRLGPLQPFAHPPPAGGQVSFSLPQGDWRLIYGAMRRARK